jgi:hypothetical protein
MVLLGFLHWRRQRCGVGLVFAYVIHLWLLHWLAPVFRALPATRLPTDLATFDGYVVSFYGFCAFAAGVLALPVPREAAVDGPVAPMAARRLANSLLVAGALAYALFFTPVARLPSVTSLVFGAVNLVVVGFALHCWMAWHSGKPVWPYLALALLLPLATTVFQGFLSYGMGWVLTLCTFVGAIYRPRWKIALASVVAIYVALSVVVTYLTHRKELRAVAWSHASLEMRLEKAANVMGDLQWLNPNDPIHQWRLDERFNQSALVGNAMAWTRYHGLARGETLWDGVVALVPRALWPSKPVVAGSMDVVTRYTGIEFAEGTSVGIGHILESYLNFGVPGVVIVMFALGLATALIDREGARSLHAGDPVTFARWFLAGIPLLNIGGSFVELTSSVAAALILGWLLRYATARAAVRGRSG